jgi:hypothetical protein
MAGVLIAIEHGVHRNASRGNRRRGRSCRDVLQGPFPSNNPSVVPHMLLTGQQLTAGAPGALHSTETDNTVGIHHRSRQTGHIWSPTPQGKSVRKRLERPSGDAAA